MVTIENKFLVFVGVDGVQSNKFYNMTPNGKTFEVEYGRIDASSTKMTYPIEKWNSIYNSKTRKGYKDITDLKNTTQVVAEASGNSDFDEFYDVFSKYTSVMVKKTFLAEGCTQAQLDAAQKVLDTIVKLKKVDDVNDNLLELYKILPRRMNNVNHYLISDIKDRDRVVNREQDAIDSMDSSNIIHKTNPYKELNLDVFKKASKKDIKMLENLLYPTRGHHSVTIRGAFKVVNNMKHQSFKQHVDNQKNKDTEYLIHGTRNPNIFSILKSGLMIRPSNAAVISGAAYGNGIYHSAHTAKSLGYTGWDPDKVFLIQNVHMGKPYVYSGWYRDGKDISRDQMSFSGLSKLGYDSLYVKPGDGLLNSEYIVYKEEQTVTSFVVWMK